MQINMHNVIHRVAVEVGLVVLVVGVAVLAEMAKTGMAFVPALVELVHIATHAVTDVTAAEITVVALLRLFGAAE